MAIQGHPSQYLLNRGVEEGATSFSELLYLPLICTL